MRTTFSALALALVASLALLPSAADASPSAAGSAAQRAVGDALFVARAAADARAPRLRSSTEGGAALAPGRATTRVTREQLELRLPRSAPDALRYEPGVFIQQSAQSQASPFVRGRTGQQVLLLFDGVRMNNSLYRQGPNQYFFTVDVRTIDRLDVVRGPGSVRFGSDAISGAINAVPRDPTRTHGAPSAAPRLYLDYGSASDEFGGRAQLDAQLHERVGVFGGIGARRVGLLESAGPVRNPRDGELPEVPRFADDGRTQLGTGFDEVAGDARVVVDAERGAWTLASYHYRQTDAPRTDQCAPPFAPADECLTFDVQARALSYLRWFGDAAPRVRELSWTLSWQRQHERRTHERPSSFTVNRGEDSVQSFGTSLRANTPALSFERGNMGIDWGAELQHDRVASRASLLFTDVEPLEPRPRSRGQYLDGSRYTSAGGFAEARALFGDWTLRAGSRVAHASASAPADPESESAAVDRSWTTAVSGAGVAWQATPGFSIDLGVDEGFRAPNLDDLTSRQRTGPGFQLENAALGPERALSLEVGAHVRSPWVDADAWAYRSTLRDAITRVNREASDCPTGTPSCQNSWSVLQLINAPGAALLYGAEGLLAIRAPGGLELRSTVAYAYGAQPDPSGPGRVPLSRVPPLNGTHALVWRSAAGVTLHSTVQWATLQDRLAASDVADERIPRGGTPGYAVWHAGVSYRSELAVVSLVMENLLDTPWRTHGSSVNGAARSVVLHGEFGLRIPREAAR